MRFEYFWEKVVGGYEVPSKSTIDALVHAERLEAAAELMSIIVEGSNGIFDAEKTKQPSDQLSHIRQSLGDLFSDIVTAVEGAKERLRREANPHPR